MNEGTSYYLLLGKFALISSIEVRADVVACTVPLRSARAHAVFMFCFHERELVYNSSSFKVDLRTFSHKNKKFP